MRHPENAPTKNSFYICLFIDFIIRAHTIINTTTTMTDSRVYSPTYPVEYYILRLIRQILLRLEFLHFIWSRDTTIVCESCILRNFPCILFYVLQMKCCKKPQWELSYYCSFMRGIQFFENLNFKNT